MRSFARERLETITSVQRAYWSCVRRRNLQIQRDAVRDGERNSIHNRRMVNEGQLALRHLRRGADAGFEQTSSLHSKRFRLETAKNLIAQNRQTALWSDSSYLLIQLICLS